MSGKYKKLKKLGELLEENYKSSNTVLLEIKKEFDKKLKKEILKLLQQIAIGEELDYEELKQKYSKKKKKNKKDNLINSKDFEGSNILDRVNLDGTSYWINRKEGIIYNDDTIIVGKIENDTYVINS